MKLVVIAAILCLFTGCSVSSIRPPYPSTLPPGFGGTTEAEELAAAAAFGWPVKRNPAFPRVTPTRP